MEIHSHQLRGGIASVERTIQRTGKPAKIVNRRGRVLALIARVQDETKVPIGAERIASESLRKRRLYYLHGAAMGLKFYFSVRGKIYVMLPPPKRDRLLVRLDHLLQPLTASLSKQPLKVTPAAPRAVKSPNSWLAVEGLDARMRELEKRMNAFELAIKQKPVRRSRRSAQSELFQVPNADQDGFPPGV